MGARRSRVLAVTAGAVLIMGMGGGVAVGHGMIDGSEVRNHTLTGRDMARNSVGAYQLAPSGVRSHHIRNGHVRWRDMAPWVKDHINSIDGRRGPRGPEGPAGPSGAPGADGEDGVLGYEVIGRGSASAVGTGQPQLLHAGCTNGQVALGGGLAPTNVDASDLSALSGLTIHSSTPDSIYEVTDPSNRPESDPNGIWYAQAWTVAFTAPEGMPVQAYVTCADAPEPDTQ